MEKYVSYKKKKKKNKKQISKLLIERKNIRNR